MTRSWILALTIAAGFSSVAAAAPASPAEQAALGDLVTAYEQAIRSGEVPKSGIRQRLAAGFSAALPSGQLVASYGELSKAENALRTMVGRGARYETTEVTVDPGVEISGELAAFNGRTKNHATAQGGKALSFTTHWSAVARKEGDSWKLLRHQAVMDPSTNPWHREESGGGGGVLAVLAGLIGGAVGLVLGWMAARRLGSPRIPVASSPAPPVAGGSRPRAWESSPPTAPEAPTPDAPASESAPARSWQPPASPEPADPPTTVADDAPPKPIRKRSWES